MSGLIRIVSCPFRTNETVDWETPAFTATSFIVARVLGVFSLSVISTTLHAGSVLINITNNFSRRGFAGFWAEKVARVKATEE